MSRNIRNNNVRDYRSSPTSMESIYNKKAARMFKKTKYNSCDLVRGHRPHDKVEREHVFKIAKLFFKDELPVTEIAKEFDVSKGTIYMITSGKSHVKDWADAVVNLVSSGVKCERLQKKRKPVKKVMHNRSLSIETVKEIRTRAKNGETKTQISKAMGISKPTIINVVDFKNYTSKEYWI